MAVVKRDPRTFFPYPRHPHQEMRLGVVSLDHIGIQLLDDLPQPPDYPGIEGETLLNAIDSDPHSRCRFQELVRTFRRKRRFCVQTLKRSQRQLHPAW